MHKKLIITGGLGHIGSYLIRHPVIKQFDETIVIDNLMSQRHCSVFNIGNDIKLKEIDLRYDDLSEVFEGVHTIVHLAATVNAAETTDDDGSTRINNYVATQRILEAAALSIPATIIYMSTTSVYGPSDEKRAEDSKNLYAQTPYAVYKHEAESLIMEQGTSNRRYIFRAGTLFGFSPGMRFHTVTNKFLWQAITGVPITIWHPGTGLRPYVSIEDITYAISQSMDYHNNYESGIYNIVTGHWNPNQIVSMIRKYRENVKVEYVIPRILNQDSYIIDTNKATKEGLLRNIVDPDEQLESYIKHMLTNIFKEVNP